MFLQYGELRPTNGWDRFGSLVHSSKFQRVSRFFSAKFHYASWFEAGRRQVRSWSVCVMEFGFYCSDVAQRRPNKLCTMFGPLVGWYIIYTFSGTLDPWRNFATCKIHFASKSCFLLRPIGSITARARHSSSPAARSAKLCGAVQRMELRYFRTRRHLYSAERPSRWASAHILV